jgi:hypothetical protein
MALATGIESARAWWRLDDAGRESALRIPKLSCPSSAVIIVTRSATPSPMSSIWFLVGGDLTTTSTGSESASL